MHISYAPLTQQFNSLSTTVSILWKARLTIGVMSDPRCFSLPFTHPYNGAPQSIPLSATVSISKVRHTTVIMSDPRCSGMPLTASQHRRNNPNPTKCSSVYILRPAHHRNYVSSGLLRPALDASHHKRNNLHLTKRNIVHIIRPAHHSRFV